MQDHTDWKTLYPGEEVALVGTKETIMVYPLGLDHIFRFGAELEAIITAVKDVAIRTDAPPNEVGRALVAAVKPVLMTKAKALMSDCCSMSLDGAPLKVLPGIAEAWIRQSFEGADLFPIIAVVKKLMSNLTGSPSLSAFLSLASSRLATALKTSSIIISEIAEAGTSPIQAGQSGNTPTTSPLQQQQPI